MLLVAALVYHLFDTVGVSSLSTCETTVHEKKYHESHTTFIMSGASIIPVIQPESFYLSFFCNGTLLDSEVTEEIYNSVEVGTHIRVTLGIGRLSGDMVVNGLEIAE